jgi:hypothetical protein
LAMSFLVISRVLKNIVIQTTKPLRLEKPTSISTSIPCKYGVQALSG